MIRYLVTAILIITTMTILLTLMGSLLEILRAVYTISHYSAMIINHTQIEPSY